MKIISNLVEAHIFRRKGGELELLAIKRTGGLSYPNLWQMVTGGIQDGEKAYITALREIKEETGLTPKRLWSLPNINSFYSSEDDCIFMIPVFAAEVDAEDTVTISFEHSEYKWIGKDEMIEILAWPGQKKSVEILHEYLSNENKIINLVEIKI
ncbi:MAG: NUDIX domain-containing protein [Chlorobi bacterium]|nr:NUDIX domain-containing protein [Chlorobiota bacterium]